MPPWIKPFRDWAMRDLWPLFRQSGGPHPEGLHYAWEKAGLTLENQPVPWNAEAVLVQGLVHFPKQAPRNKSEFSLRLGKQTEPILPESWLSSDHHDGVR